ncbi:MAG TPA: 50S ribosomal protein L24 [Planctomycetota bacterium]|nr:50S ribosomal protein L24 [Planctomycetota bacterium]
MVIRKNDTVVLVKDITSCRNAEGSPVVAKGERTKVLAVLRRENKVILQNTACRWRHVRPSQSNPRGGRIQKEAAVHASNVLLYCEKCSRGVRVRLATVGGKKARVCAKCSSVIPVVR